MRTRWWYSPWIATKKLIGGREVLPNHDDNLQRMRQTGERRSNQYVCSLFIGVLRELRTKLRLPTSPKPDMGRGRGYGWSRCCSRCELKRRNPDVLAFGFFRNS